MSGPTHLGFRLRRSELRDRILIPKFYDPDLAAVVDVARASFDVPELGELLEPGPAGSRLGTWLRREHYGTGTVPFVRTSDLVGWRIRPDYKKGVSQRIYEDLRATQDVRAGDLLMVAHGTYLVGTMAIVTEHDLPLVLQDHVFRLRAAPGVDPHLLLAALSTSFVRRQVRSRQFSADIIDKIGDRHLGLRVPVPKGAAARAEISRRVRAVVDELTVVRNEIRAMTATTGGVTDPRAGARHRFTVKRSALRDRILVPRYYDPEVERAVRETEARSSVPWIALRELVDAKALSISGGVEVGKMAYGTGDVPFVRTSDLADWEIRRDTRHAVSSATYDQHARRGSLSPGDVLVVRDGTYLVGASAIVTDDDLPALFCGGILRLRASSDALDPHTLLAALNQPVVRRQMRARQFTRDVIDTLGNRLGEVRIADPRRGGRAIGDRVRAIMQRKVRLNAEMDAVMDALEPDVPRQFAGRPGWSMR